MSNNDLALLWALERGYTVSHDGTVYNKRGKVVKGRIKETIKKENRKGKGRGGQSHKYHTFTVSNPENGYQCRPIQTHRFVALLKFGNEIFNYDCVRHLDDNSLNNSWDNIELGSHSDNYNDAVRNGKHT